MSSGRVEALLVQPSNENELAIDLRGLPDYTEIIASLLKKSFYSEQLKVMSQTVNVAGTLSAYRQSILLPFGNNNLLRAMRKVKKRQIKYNTDIEL